MSRYQKVNIIFLAALLLVNILHFTMGLHWIWNVALVLWYVTACTVGATLLDAGFFVPVKFKGTTTGKKIALSFDDGPLHEKTDQVLDILEKYKIPAAFFCIGSRIKSNENILRRMDRSGHIVGNHSFLHGNTFDLLPSSLVLKELEDTDEAIKNVLGKKPRLFRPPYGVTNPMIAKAVKDGDYTVVGWSVRSFDTVIKSPEKLFNRVVNRLTAGDVILFHDYSDSMLQILPSFLEHAINNGYSFVRLDQLLNEQPYR